MPNARPIMVDGPDNRTKNHTTSHYPIFFSWCDCDHHTHNHKNWERRIKTKDGFRSLLISASIWAISDHHRLHLRFFFFYISLVFGLRFGFLFRRSGELVRWQLLPIFLFLRPMINPRFQVSITASLLIFSD